MLGACLFILSCYCFFFWRWRLGYCIFLEWRGSNVRTSIRFTDFSSNVISTPSFTALNSTTKRKGKAKIHLPDQAAWKEMKNLLWKKSHLMILFDAWGKLEDLWSAYLQVRRWSCWANTDKLLVVHFLFYAPRVMRKHTTYTVYKHCKYSTYAL